MLKGLLVDICRIDRQLRESFLREIIKVEDETGYKITSKELEKINSGESFHGINLWERFYNSSFENLENQRRKINEVNRLLVSGKPIDLKTLIGFFGYVLGYHEYLVHGANFKNIFDCGNSGSYFVRDIKLLSGIKEDNKKIRWLGISAFNHFCVLYYVMINTNKIIRNHYEDNKNIRFYFNDKINFSLIKKHLKDVMKYINSDDLSLVIQNKIGYIFSKIKLIAENIDYNKPIMTTISEVKPSNKRIKRFQCRLVYGPLTPPVLSDELYSPRDIIQYHDGTERAREYFGRKKF